MKRLLPRQTGRVLEVPYSATSEVFTSCPSLKLRDGAAPAMSLCHRKFPATVASEGVAIFGFRKMLLNHKLSNLYV